MSRDFFDINESLDDFRGLLTKEELEEEPVPLHEFVTSKYYLGLKPLSQIQTNIVENMSQVYFQRTLEQIHGKEEGKRIWDSTNNEIICEIGKGGGKDFSIRIAFARIIYLLHCLKDPLEYYGIGQGEYIDLLNIAVNSEQALRVFFDPLKNILRQSPWFIKQEFIPQSKKMEFLSKPIRCFSGHSEQEAWEGYNLIAVALDEISAFKIQEEGMGGGETQKFSAKAIYDMSRMSVVSRFPEVGKVALLSFPRFYMDFIETRYEAVIEERKTRKIQRNLGPIEIEWYEDEILKYKEPKVWAIKCPTFISNPTKTPEHFVSDFIRDPINAKARILCLPPKAKDAYFRDPVAVLRCFHDHDENCHLDSCPQAPWGEDGRLPNEFKDPGGPPRFIHVDLSLKRDRSALCVVHTEGFKTTPYDGQMMPVIKMDLIKYWEAPPDGEIDFGEIRRFIFSLHDRFNIAMVTMDRWNSIDTKNILMNKGIYTDFMVVDKRHYDTLATTIYDLRLSAYYDATLVDEELLRLQLINGKKVDHTRSGYKDGADCLAGAVYTCTENTPYEEVMDIEILGYEGFDVRRREREEMRKKNDSNVIEEEETKEMPENLESFLKGMKLL